MDVFKFVIFELTYLLISDLHLVFAFRLPDLQEQNIVLVSDEIKLDYKLVHRRRRRSLSDELPDEIQTKFTTSVGDLDLKFSRSKWRQERIPLQYYSFGVKYENNLALTQRKCVSIYIDVESRATALVDFCEKDLSTPHLLVDLPLNNTQHVLIPTAGDDAPDGMSHKLYRVDEPESWTHKDYAPLGETEIGRIEVADDVEIRDVKRHRRADLATPHVVELLLIIDYSLYMFWYDQTSGTDRQQQAFNNIREFYAWIISAMNQRYQGLLPFGLNIQVELVNVLVMMTPGDSPWIENNLESQNIPAEKRGSFDGEQALADFDTWIANRKASDPTFPKYDHAQLVTARDLKIDGNSAAAGYANLAAICSGKSQSVVEDHFNFLSITIFTHELGHSLGAVHDGEGNTCRGSDMFIMAAVNGALTGPDARNPWIFSLCSASDIKDKIVLLNSNGGNDNCLVTEDNSDVITTTGELLGQRYHPDEQCKLIMNSNSFVCKTLHVSDRFASICTGMWCAVADKLDNCTLNIPADGTSCGNRKWCINGECISSNDAPTADETCMFGDQLGVIQNENTCLNIVTSDLTRCYGNDIRTYCCGTCESRKTGITGCDYGDRADCSLVTTATARVCYNTTISSSDCCLTCANLKKSNLPESCAYGDRLPGCRATQAYCAANPTDCCETCSGVTTSTSTSSTKPTTTSSASDELEGWVIPVAVAGGVIVLIAVIIGLIICFRRSSSNPTPSRPRHRHRNRNRDNTHTRDNPPPYDRHRNNGRHAYYNPGMNHHGGYISRY